MDENTGFLTCLPDGLRFTDEAIHDLAEVIWMGNFQSPATGFESLGFLEALVVGAEDNGNIPYGSLQCIMETYTKSSSYVGHISITVDAGQQPETVDNKDIRVRDSRSL